MGVQSIKKADCPSCGDHATYPFLEYDQQTKSAVLCGREAVQIRPPQQQERNLSKIAEKLEKLDGKVELNDFLLSFSVGEERLVLFTEDRKSTRLNSSHVSISYAVFCLKKKIIIT